MSPSFSVLRGLRVLRSACTNHPHLTTCAVLFLATRVGLVLILYPRLQAFPEPRMLFLTALFTLPSWGIAMSCYRAVGCWRGMRRKDPDELDKELAWLVLPAHEGDRDVIFGAAVRRRRRLLNLGPNYQTSVACGSLAMIGLVLLATFTLPENVRYQDEIRHAQRGVPSKAQAGHGSTGDTRIFIAAMFHNNEAVIPHWTKEILRVISYIGVNNVFVSVVESYSEDNSPALLRAFESDVILRKIPHRILIQDTTIERPASMVTSPARIEFLAATRNQAIEPLLTMGKAYDRILFTNDVYIHAESILELLATNGGEYDMACGLDFQSGGLYDLWVTRDQHGNIVSGLFPYLLEPFGFRAILADKPAPVSACWNGVVSISADPFLPPHLRLLRAPGRRLANHTLPPLPPSHPDSVSKPQTPLLRPPLTFRASSVDRGECFSSECFNLPYDLRRLFALDRIFVNPRVITAYKLRFYLWFRYVLRHWLVKWWMTTVEVGLFGGMAEKLEAGKVILHAGNSNGVWRWDGGECHPGPVSAALTPALWNVDDV